MLMMLEMRLPVIILVLLVRKVEGVAQKVVASPVWSHAKKSIDGSVGTPVGSDSTLDCAVIEVDNHVSYNTLHGNTVCRKLFTRKSKGKTQIKSD